jgi:hypothetical protein
MRKTLLSLLALCLTGPAAAVDVSAVDATLRLRHLDADRWQAEYALAEAVDCLDFGAPIVAYRASAWHGFDSGVRLQMVNSHERLCAAEPRREWSLQIDYYPDWAHDSYVPMDRHSDGGTAVYLGHLQGEAVQGAQSRPLALRFELQGWKNEQVLLPARANAGDGVYAWFGPAAVGSDTTLALIDPATPAWLLQTLDEVVAKVPGYFQQALQRRPAETPLVMIGASGFDQPGMSIKGGALPGQIVFKISGRDLLAASDGVKAQVQHLVAHELAHVWQNALRQGGIGESEAWVHEGGAEAMALAALQHSGLWTAEQAERFGKDLVDACLKAEQQSTPEDPWRMNYSCGYRRFAAYPLAPIELWRHLIDESERSGEVYSPALVERVLATATAGSR